MTAQIIQFIPKPNPNREKELERQTMEAAVKMGVAMFGVPNAETIAAILELQSGVGESIPYNGEGIDGMDLTPDSA